MGDIVRVSHLLKQALNPPSTSWKEKNNISPIPETQVQTTTSEKLLTEQQSLPHDVITINMDDFREQIYPELGNNNGTEDVLPPDNIVVETASNTEAEETMETLTQACIVCNVPLQSGFITCGCLDFTF